MQSGPEFFSVLSVKIFDLSGVSDMESMDLSGMSVDSVHSLALESFYFSVLRRNPIVLRLCDVFVPAHE